MAPRGAGGSVLECRAPGFCLGTPCPEMSRAASSSCSASGKPRCCRVKPIFLGGGSVPHQLWAS